MQLNDNIEKHLSRNIYILDKSGLLKAYNLSILVIEKDRYGEIIKYNIVKFNNEIASVVYHDSPLLLSETNNQRFSFSEITDIELSTYSSIEIVK